MTVKARATMTIYVVTDIGGRFIKAFQDEGNARTFVLSQPGKFNMHEVVEDEMVLAYPKRG